MLVTLYFVSKNEDVKYLGITTHILLWKQHYQRFITQQPIRCFYSFPSCDTYVFRVQAHTFFLHRYSHFSFSYSIVLSKVPIKTSLEKYLPTYVFVGLFVCRQKGKSKCLIMLQLLLFKTNFHQIRFDKKWRGIAPRWNQRLCCNCLLLKKCLIGFLYTFQKMDKKVSVMYLWRHEAFCTKKSICNFFALIICQRFMIP